jgi:methionyl-tRNA synthetase
VYLREGRGNRGAMEKPLYVTTTIPYVNAEPHIGFALEIVQADAVARLARLFGREVFFTTGTDEHGQKIWEKAQEAGEDVQAYVDRNAESVKRLKDLLNLSYNAFIRTTDVNHKTAAQELWRRCDEVGDIYKKRYEGLYCVGCEKFLSEKDLDENGNCPLHPNKRPVTLCEENYFFRLSKYQTLLEEYLANPAVIVPEHRRLEALAFTQGGLEDFSISREKERLPWGVPVPGDDTQVMYVWFDALTNYLSTLGWPEDTEGSFNKFWVAGETLQMAGKDQIRFQSIMWQAILTSAGLPRTGQVFYHGFINSQGERMSKSLGNVISPRDMVERYGVDATRYMLLRHVHPFEDTDVTFERMDEWYEANLVNGLGNLVARVMKMASEYLSGPAKVEEIKPMSDVLKFTSEFAFHRSLDAVWSTIAALDESIQKEQPFKTIKTDPQRAQEQVEYLVRELWRIAGALRPFMPTTSTHIEEAITRNQKPENLFPRLA